MKTGCVAHKSWGHTAHPALGYITQECWWWDFELSCIALRVLSCNALILLGCTALILLSWIALILLGCIALIVLSCIALITLGPTRQFGHVIILAARMGMPRVIMTIIMPLVICSLIPRPLAIFPVTLTFSPLNSFLFLVTMTFKEARRDETSALERPSVAARQSAICDTRVPG